MNVIYRIFLVASILLESTIFSAQNLEADKFNKQGLSSFMEGNCSVALESFLNAKRAGSQVADYNIGMIYEKCKSMKKDLEQAIYYYKYSAMYSKDSSTQSLSCSQLASIYFYEYNDTLKALDWFRQSTKNNLARAYYNYGLFLFYNMNENELRSQGFNMIVLAADKGDLTAMEQLARIYLLGGYGVKKDNNLAYEWVLRAKALNENCCFSILGQIYQDGLNNEPDLLKALYYFRKGEEQNDSESLYYLGCFPIFTDSVQIEYLKRAARLGFDLAKESLKYRKIQW